MLRTVLPLKILRLRELNGLSQAQLAVAAGISASTLNGIERGQANDLSLRVLLRLCRFFVVTPDYLLGFTDGDSAVRSIYDHGRVVYLLAAAEDGEVHYCLDCGSALTPLRAHTIPECIFSMKEHGRKVAFIAARFSMTGASVRQVIEEELRLLRLRRNHLPKAIIAPSTGSAS